MSPENPGALNAHNLALTAATYDVASFLGPDAVASLPSLHTAGPDGRTIAEIIEAERSSDSFLAMRREYTGQALAAIIPTGETTQE